MSTEIAASIIIPTRNRKDHLRRAIASAMRQSVPVEVIVLDDASTDGTPEMMAAEFPELRYERQTETRGPSFLRNLGARLAHGTYIFPIDDDAEFVSENTVRQTISDFSDPRIGAVGIPFINVNKDQAVIHQQSPAQDGIFVIHAYIGCAHALRREVFLAAGGYHEEFFYMGEEGDLCLRMLQLGYVVRCGRADPMHHHESPSRISARAAKYGRQNDILFAIYNVPRTRLLLHLAATTFNGLRFMFRCIGSTASHHVAGLLRGYIIGLRGLKKCRKPVSIEVYDLFRQLKRSSPVLWETVIPRLPSAANTPLPG